MRGKKTAAMPPEPRPDDFPVGGRQIQLRQLGAGKKGETPLRMRRRLNGQTPRHFKQKHQPMSVPLIPVFAHQSRQAQIPRGQGQADFLPRLAAGARVGGFADVRVEFAAARTPPATIGFLRAFEQQHVIVLVEAIKERGDFVRQLHARSETGVRTGGKP